MTVLRLCLGPAPGVRTLWFGVHSSSSMSVTVKAYLLGKDEHVKEIRRFAVDQDVSCNFEYLSKKTAAVFSNLMNSSFNLFYKGEPHGPGQTEPGSAGSDRNRHTH